MDPGLRRAWTEIVVADDYEEHMASIGQSQAAAELTRCLIERVSLPTGSRITIAGAGTGQMFDFLNPAVFRPYRLTYADLNPAFLVRLRELGKQGLHAEIVHTLDCHGHCGWPPNAGAQRGTHSCHDSAGLRSPVEPGW